APTWTRWSKRARSEFSLSPAGFSAREATALPLVHRWRRGAPARESALALMLVPGSQPSNRSAGRAALKERHVFVRSALQQRRFVSAIRFGQRCGSGGGGVAVQRPKRD